MIKFKKRKGTGKKHSAAVVTSDDGGCVSVIALI